MLNGPQELLICINLIKGLLLKRGQRKSPTAKSKAAPKKSAAEAVTKTKQRRYIEELQDDNKVWTVQEISRLKPNEFAALEKDIDRAVKDGRVVQSL